MIIRKKNRQLSPWFQVVPLSYMMLRAAVENFPKLFSKNLVEGLSHLGRTTPTSSTLIFFGCLAICFLSRTPKMGGREFGKSRLRSARVLKGFGWFCSKENRKHIECIIADLKKDKREMRRDHRGNGFIACVLLWKSLDAVLPIMWDATKRLIKTLLPIGRIIAHFKWF